MKVTAESPSPRSPVATAVATIGTAATASAAAPSESVVIGSAGGKLAPGWEASPSASTSPHMASPESPQAASTSSTCSRTAAHRSRPSAAGSTASPASLAILTGVIAHADPPGLPGSNFVGRRVGVSVQDNTHGHDRIG
jgi:hypothetical protein